MFFLLMIAANFGLEPGTVEIRHNREDLTVEKLWIATSCLDQDGKPTRQDCVQVFLDEQIQAGLIELEAEGNIIRTGRISFQFDESSGKIFCVGMKVIFHGFPNQVDYQLYVDPRDRYSILSFCNVDNLPGPIASQPRFSHRRAKTWDEFATKFAQPLNLQLK